MKKYIAIGAVALMAWLFYMFCLNHVAVTDIGVAYNSLNGDIKVQSTPGWYVTSPFVRVCTMSTLPILVRIPSSSRIINQKLVRFRPEGAVAFVKLQGFSVTIGPQLENILLGYAYSGEKYEFLEILEEPKPSVSGAR